jgi:hypothetical protein
MVDTTSPSKIPATESTELPNATPSMSPGAEPTTLNTEPTIAPSISPSLGAPPAVGNSPHSRSIQIARTGQVIATSNNLGPLRFSIIDGEEYTLGLPGGPEINRRVIDFQRRLSIWIIRLHTSLV